MRFRFFGRLDEILANQVKILAGQSTLATSQARMGLNIMSALDDLKKENAGLGTSIVAAVATLTADALALKNAAAAAKANPDDSADLEALAADLHAKSMALNAAVNPPDDSGTGTASAGATPVAGQDTVTGSTGTVGATS